MYTLARSICFYVPRKCRGVILILCFLLVGISLLLGIHLMAVLVGTANHEMKMTEKVLKENIPTLATDHTKTPSTAPNLPHLQDVSCDPLSPKILLFIRIPKCASTSFLSIAEQLSSSQTVAGGAGGSFSLHFNPSGAYDWNTNTINNVVATIREQSSIGERFMYIRHFYYVNFDDHTKREQPLPTFSYISIVRDPVSRLVSSYLYYHFSTKPHIQRILDPQHRNESLEMCIMYLHEGCTPNLMTKYFCGHEKFCSSGSMDALEKAKRNIERHFAVIGLMESLSETYLLYKTLLPSYFKDLDVNQSSTMRRNKNEKSMDISDSLKEKIEEANRADVLLYRYIRARLLKQLTACGIKSRQN